jgi:hypothetical protein
LWRLPASGSIPRSPRVPYRPPPVVHGRVAGLTCGRVRWRPPRFARPEFGTQRSGVQTSPTRHDGEGLVTGPLAASGAGRSPPPTHGSHPCGSGTGRTRALRASHATRPPRTSRTSSQTDMTGVGPRTSSKRGHEH